VIQKSTRDPCRTVLTVVGVVDPAGAVELKCLEHLLTSTRPGKRFSALDSQRSGKGRTPGLSRNPRELLIRLRNADYFQTAARAAGTPPVRGL
jgi:hypothetical protein